MVHDGPEPKSQNNQHDILDVDVRLKSLGWNQYFIDQVVSTDLRETPPVRIMQVHRSNLHVVGVNVDIKIPSLYEVAVGDWLLLNQGDPRSSKILKRRSLLKRRAAGHDRKEQLIAANLDTAFIVSSCNSDFNLARLERYIAMINEAEITPVIILTKFDLNSDLTNFSQLASKISERVAVINVDARSSSAKEQLAPWCELGQTVAFLGSSGVGKSTLTNTLAGNPLINTQAVREVDDKGRHTTTSRQLHIIPQGCAVIDTPGMRELQLTDAATGIKETFADLHELEQSCRFNDCSHDHEPGCAIQANITIGLIDVIRVNRWLKLVSEDQENTKVLAKRFSKENTTKDKIGSGQKHKQK
jgi:ribosome biogenesis GTPase